MTHPIYKKRDTVLEALEDWKDIAELLEKVDARQDTIYYWIRQLKKEGLIEEKDVWGRNGHPRHQWRRIQ